MAREAMRIGVVAAVLVAVLFRGARSATLRVPEDYATIQAAIDASAAGDSILVGPGTWDQRNVRSLQDCFLYQTKASVAFLKPGILLMATAGPDVTILDGGPQDVAAVETVMLASLDGPSTRVEGFTITGGGDAIDVGCTDSEVEVVNCRLVDNGLIGINTAYAKVSLIDCLVARNQGSDVAEGGALISTGSNFEAIRTRFESNPMGAIHSGHAQRIFVEECEFVDHPTRGAVDMFGCSALTIRNSLFLRDRTTVTSLSGGAIGVGGSVGTIEFNTFAYDSAVAANGGAIDVASNSWITVQNNTFYRCYTQYNGAAILMSESTMPTVGNIITGCTGLSALARFDGTLLGSGCNLLWDNTSDYFQWPAGAMATDVHADPEFCDPEHLDFTVKDTSPAAPANSGECGQIGAFGVGCGSVSVEPSTWGRIKSSFRTAEEGK
jgi:Right handed beta helix region